MKKSDKTVRNNLVAASVKLVGIFAIAVVGFTLGPAVANAGISGVPGSLNVVAAVAVFTVAAIAAVLLLTSIGNNVGNAINAAVAGDDELLLEKQTKENA